MATLQEVKDKLAVLQADTDQLIARPAGASDSDLQPIADGIDTTDAKVKAALGQ